MNDGDAGAVFSNMDTRFTEPHKPSPIMRHFKFGHLPEKLQPYSKPICELADEMDKLLEAKDACVRAALEDGV